MSSGNATAPRLRVKELRYVKAADIQPNAQNWRIHPAPQSAALQGMLDEVGIVDALIAYEAAGEDGEKKLTLIDGHLRRETAPDTEWPVLVLDVSEEEAKKVLLTLDPLAGMAETNEEMVRGLLAEVKIEVPEIQGLLEELTKSAGLTDGTSQAGSGASAITATLTIPPRVWLTMRDALKEVGEAFAAQYGAAWSWPD